MDRSREAAGFRAQVQQAALFALLKGGVPTAGAQTAWRALTEAAGRTLEVARASIWILSTRAVQQNPVKLVVEAEG